jgi:hypothetical protein
MTAPSTSAPRLDLVDFTTMEHRIRYMVDSFGDHIGGRVLDVGCDQRYLNKLRPDLDYVGMDQNEVADLSVDLETMERLPFEDGEFDTVVCCDVLEHLDRLHHTLGELVRVSRRHLIISLPNCWTAARLRIARGHGEIGLYGLPHEPVADRHKWFFSLSEALSFVPAMAAKHGLDLLDLRVVERPRNPLLRGLRRLRWPKREHYLNRYAHTLFAVYAKPGE